MYALNRRGAALLASLAGAANLLRIPIAERPGWRQRAADFGFHFHTMYGEPYWDESAYYQFTLAQIERDLEEPTEELHQMCLAVVDDVIASEQLLSQFQIPEMHWQAIADSWRNVQPSLYSRLDLAYTGQGPAKFLENNADTPTSLYESGFWQWLWLEDNVERGALPRQSDQFNSLQEKLVNRFAEIGQYYQTQHMHFSCCKDTVEDRGTVQYLQDCAAEAGFDTRFVYVEDIGLATDDKDLWFTDLDDYTLDYCFKLYPWEFMLRESFAEHLVAAQTQWLEPMWKAILSNKALLPALWKKFPNHPNLLPAFFSDEVSAGSVTLESGQRWVHKPIFSREGANIKITQDGDTLSETDGPYGEEGHIIQAFTPLPKFEQNYTLIGSWLVNDKAAGISVREDKSPITQDLSRYLPHIIL